MKYTAADPIEGSGRGLLDSSDHLNIDSAGDSASEFTHLLANGHTRNALLANGHTRNATSATDKSSRADFYGKGKAAGIAGLEEKDEVAGGDWTWMWILPAIVLPTIGTGMRCVEGGY